MTWTDAPCHGRTTDFIFNTDDKRGATRLRIDSAKTLCGRCPHRAECLEAELDVMRGGVTSVGVFGATTVADRRKMLNPDRRQGQAYVCKPLTHGDPSCYRRCVRRPEGSCDACRRAHARVVAERRGSRGRADHAVAWTRRFIRRLRAEAYTYSLALRTEVPS